MKKPAWTTPHFRPLPPPDSSAVVLIYPGSKNVIASTQLFGSSAPKPTSYLISPVDIKTVHYIQQSGADFGGRRPEGR